MASQAMAPMKLHYLAIPGRAEVSRLCMMLAGIPFQDVPYDLEVWPQHKPKMPFGQVPVLELPDGKMLAQSGAIDRYVAKLAGLYPEDPWQAALADQAAFLVAEIYEPLVQTIYLPESEKVEVRRAMLAGPAKERLQRLATLLESSPGGYVAGDKLSYGDIIVYVMLCNLSSGFFDGLPANLLDAHPPSLETFRARVASLPPIRAHYERHGGGLRAAYRPEAPREVPPGVLRL